MMCIPTLVLILALISIIEKPTIWHLMVVIGVFGWTGIARLTRAEFLKLRQLEYVTAARALGFRWSRLMFRHILPNALAPVIVPITFGIAAAILLETTLSFLGIGAPDKTSWEGSSMKVREFANVVADCFSGSCDFPHRAGLQPDWRRDPTGYRSYPESIETLALKSNPLRVLDSCPLILRSLKVTVIATLARPHADHQPA